MLFPMRASAQEATPHPPLKETDVVKLLVSKVSPARLRSLVKKYGIDFPVDPSLEVLIAAGADPELIKALRAAEQPASTTAISEPTPTQMALPPVRPSATARPTTLGRGPRTASPAPTPALPEQDFALVRNGPRGDIYLAKHEVTNREYLAYCTRYKLRPAKAPPFGTRPSFPVVNVTWDDAVGYCRALSHETGRTYRLPTEVEWELAASGGDPRRTYPWGEDSPSGRACFGKGRLCPVGSFPHTSLDLFDMAGSAAEWVAGKDAERVVKGGSWATPPEGAHFLAISSRVKMEPKKPSYEVGFRVAMEP
jgi:hypothetical protein